MPACSRLHTLKITGGDNFFLHDRFYLTGTSLVTLLRLTGSSLRVLELAVSGLNLSPADLASVSLPGLEGLALQCNALDDEAAVGLLARAGDKIRSLKFSSRFWTLATAVDLPAYRRLEELELGSCQNVATAAICSLVRHAGPRLRHLNLAKINDRFSLADIAAMRMDLVNLETLRLGSQSVEVIDRLFCMVGDRLRFLDIARNIDLGRVLNLSLDRLEELNLANCGPISEPTLMRILNRTGSTLRSLNLSYTHIDLSYQDELTTDFPLLEKLVIFGNALLTHNSLLMNLVRRLGPNLTELWLAYSGVSFVGEHQLTARFPKLWHLMLYQCHNIELDCLLRFLGRTSGKLNICLTNTNIDSKDVKAVFPYITFDMKPGAKDF